MFFTVGISGVLGLKACKFIKNRLQYIAPLILERPKSTYPPILKGPEARYPPILKRPKSILMKFQIFVFSESVNQKKIFFMYIMSSF